ncbi:hypothetical protein [Endozoicomonas euniceicola]|uniref:Uncharacterized protein n=1 Tax=Endozoicomonas euniceicola TaxID=1234143 RepID=A0ABY6GY53_9GAMM|nr:hypothetical protein [Endozoicomonas euniceicola]UYM17720.1 hypothetical protein NX720_07375 [Endozoicomonas euniceicola]
MKISQLILILLLTFSASVLANPSEGVNLNAPQLQPTGYWSEDVKALLADKKHILIVSGHANAGLGDYSYGWNLYHHLSETYPNHPITVLFYGSKNDKSKVQKLFDIDLKTNRNIIWMTVEYEDTEEGGDYAKIRSDFSTETRQALKNLEQMDRSNRVTVFIASKLYYVNALLKKVQVTPDLNINHLSALNFSCPEGYPWEVFTEFLSGIGYTGNITDKSNTLFNDYWLTDCNYYGKFLTYTLSSLSLIAEKLDLKSHIAKKLGLQWGYKFGLSSDHEAGYSDRTLGLMLSEELKTESEDYHANTTSQRLATLEKKIPVKQKWLEILTGETDRACQLQWLENDGSYFTGYMQDVLSQLEFIATTAPMAAPDKDLKYILNMGDMIAWADYMYKDSHVTLGDSLKKQMIERSGVLEPIFRDNNITRLVYWSEKTGKHEYALGEGGRTLWIINPFPLPKEQLHMLMIASRQPVSACTGDHSFYDVLATGKVAFHEEVPHLFDLHQRLAKLAEQEGFIEVRDYFNTFRGDEKRPLIKTMTDTGEWARFVEYLYNNENAYKKLPSLLAPYLSE